MIAVRTVDVHGRVILDVDGVPSLGGEAATTMTPFDQRFLHARYGRGVRRNRG